MYEKALVLEFVARAFHLSSSTPLMFAIKGTLIGEGRIDLFVFGKIIIELKLSIRSFPSTPHKWSLTSKPLAVSWD